jgi:hypothetical protein
VKAERLPVRLRAVSGLDAPGNLADGPGGSLDEPALTLTDTGQFTLRGRVTMTTAWIGGFSDPPISQCAGALPSVSPRVFERCGREMSSWNSIGTLHRTCGGNPIAARPAAVTARLIADEGLIFVPSGATGHGADEVIEGASCSSQACA